MLFVASRATTFQYISFPDALTLARAILRVHFIKHGIDVRAQTHVIFYRTVWRKIVVQTHSYWTSLSALNMNDLGFAPYAVIIIKLWLVVFKGAVSKHGAV